MLLPLPLWLAEALPLVDVPQHAAQLLIGAQWSRDAALQHVYEFNPYANQLLVPALAALLRPFVGVVDVLRIALSLALLGVPMVAVWAVRRVKGNTWLVLLTFPITYGYAFYWGFVSFCLAVPLGLLGVAAAWAYVESPSWRRAAVIVLAVHLLFYSHVLVLAWTGLAAGLLVLVGARSWKARLGGFGALASILPLAFGWWVSLRSAFPSSHDEPSLLTDAGPQRFAAILAAVMGRTPEVWAVAAGLALLALPFAMGARWSRDPRRWAPLVATVLSVGLLPLHLLGTALVYPRFAVFLVPALVFALELGPARARFPRVREVAKWTAVAAAVGGSAFVAAQFRGFDRESRPGRELVASIPAGSRVLGLIENPGSAWVPWYPYVHFVMWYQVWVGGVADFSFAEFFPNRYRYPRGTAPPLPRSVEWLPEVFAFDRHGGAIFDYFLVRRADPSYLGVPGRAPERVELVERRGEWELWRRRVEETRSPESAARPLE